MAEEGYLVILGIKPSYPATGYGYIKQGKLDFSTGVLTGLTGLAGPCKRSVFVRQVQFPLAVTAEHARQAGGFDGRDQCIKVAGLDRDFCELFALEVAE